MNDRVEQAEPDYRAFFEAAPGLHLVLRPDLMIVAVSDAYLRATMTNRDEILGRNLFDVFPDNPDDPGATGVSNLRASLDQVRTALVPDTMAVQKYDIRRPDAEGGGFEERFWSPVNTPVLSSTGELTSIIHRVEDVTEFVRLKNLETEQQRLNDELRSRAATMEAEVLARAQEIAKANRELQRANEELRRSQFFLDSIIENIPDMVFVKDARDLRFVRLNRAGEELLGRSREEMIGRNDYAFFPKDEADFFTTRDREVLESRRLVDIPEEPIDTANLGRRVLHTKKIPILGDHGRPAYLLGISEDVTDRKATELALQEAHAAAEVANRAKSQFLSRMSHELRTPLNAILGFAQLLGMDHLDDDQRESQEQILKGGRHLLSLINEVLDITRIESGQLALSLEPIRVGDLVADAISLMSPVGAKRGVEIRSRVGKGDWNILADRQRVKQVLLNFLGNAVKYSPPGAVATVLTERAGDRRIRITVADTGPGISPELLPRLFSPFDRLGREATEIEGTGLGLALSKALVKAMGGTIGVDSTPGEGSTFWLELPVATPAVNERSAEPPAPATTAAGATPAGTILYIEDNLSNFRLIERTLALRANVRLLPAMLGGLGLDLAREHRPDLVLLDLHLPDMSGEELLARLRADPPTHAIPVVVLSADATPGQVERLLADGARAYLTKPLDISAFLALVDEVLAPGTPADPGTP